MTERTTARAVGVLFLVIGVLGLLPGLTSHYGDLRFADGSHGKLLGEFRVSVLVNLVHVLLGAVALVTARAVAVALASLMLWLIGVSAAGAWLSLDTATNWLHFVLGVLALALTAAGARTAARAAAA